MLVYEPFFADFGPLNMGQTYRYCRLLEKYLGEPKLAKKRIVHYTSNEAQPRHNAVVLPSTRRATHVDTSRACGLVSGNT